MEINNDISSAMQVAGEWIYYLKGKPGYPKIYRIPVTGICINDDRSVDV